MNPLWQSLRVEIRARLSATGKICVLRLKGGIWGNGITAVWADPI